MGLGDAGHLATHTEGFSFALALGPWQWDTLAQLMGNPQGTIQGVHAGATATLPFLRFMDIAYRAFAVLPFRFRDSVTMAKMQTPRPLSTSGQRAQPTPVRSDGLGQRPTTLNNSSSA